MTEVRLPTVTPPRLSELVRFDLTTGLPTALSVLRRHLGVGRTLRVILAYLVRSLRDPLRDVSTAGWPRRRERLVRHQLRAAVRVDDALRAASGLDEAARAPILADVIAQTGARFIAANVPMPQADQWTGTTAAERERYAGQVVGRFFNAQTERLDAGARHFAFDVTGCRFAQLCDALHRPHLAPLFCAADSVYFERPDSPLRLVRTETLASGGARCDFRFRVAEADPDA